MIITYISGSHKTQALAEMIITYISGSHKTQILRSRHIKVSMTIEDIMRHY